MKTSLFKALLVVSAMASFASLGAENLEEIKINAYDKATSAELATYITALSVDTPANLSQRNVTRAAALILANAASTVIAREESDKVKTVLDDNERLTSYSDATTRANTTIVTAFRNNQNGLAQWEGWVQTQLASDGTTTSLIRKIIDASKSVGTKIAELCQAGTSAVIAKIEAAQSAIEGIIAAIIACPVIRDNAGDISNA